MRPVLLDTSVYISALRRGDDIAIGQRRMAPDEPLWLSAVVLEELYAGANERDRRLVTRLERDFERIQRMLVPNLSDWTWAGRVLAELGMRYGFEKIKLGRLTNDALIAMSAARMGVRVITANERDFRRIAEFREFNWELA